jgi:hypothetical protein
MRRLLAASDTEGDSLQSNPLVLQLEGNISFVASTNATFFCRVSSACRVAPIRLPNPIHEYTSKCSFYRFVCSSLYLSLQTNEISPKRRKYFWAKM